MVNVSVTVLTLSSPDESSLKYEVEFLMHQVWHDERVQFQNGGVHKYLNALAHSDALWMPDTYFIKHGEFKMPQDSGNIALKIFPNGTILYTTR